MASLAKSEHDQELYNEISKLHTLAWEKLPQRVQEEADLDVTFLSSLIRFIFNAHVRSGRRIDVNTALDVFDIVMEEFERFDNGH